MHWLIVNGELVLYGYVGSDFWDTPHFSSRDVLEALLQIEGDVTCRLNSGGGDANEGLAIYNNLRLHAQRNGVTITMVIDGVAASAASLIAMAGDSIVMNPGSTMMIHDPSSFVFGTADEMQQSADILDMQANQYAAIYAERAGITTEAARAIMKAETWYTPEQAVEAGFATEVSSTTLMHAPSLFDYRLYPKAPTALTMLATASAMMFQPKAAVAAQPQKETGMTLEQLIAMLAGRFNVPAGEVTTMCNRAMASGIELAALVALLNNTTTMDAATTAIRNQVATMMGVTAAVQTPPVQQPNAVTMSADDVREVARRARAGGLSMEQTEPIMALPSREAAFGAIIDAVAANQVNGGRTPSATAHVTEDAREKFRAGAVMALQAKVGLEGGERNEFSGLSLAELARESLTLAGVTDARKMDRMLMIGTAFTAAPVMSGAGLATSDFAYILQNVANKSVLKGYEEVEETFQLWTSKGAASDFKPISRADLGLFPNLLKVEEGGEYKYASVGDRGVTVVLATYGRMIRINRQAIINDDLSLLGKLPVKMGRAAKRTVGNLVYGVLNANPNFVDGVALFHANHGNLAASGGAPSEAAWQAAVTAMGKQQDSEKIATALNVRPKYFLSSAYEFVAKQLLTSTATLTDAKNAGVANTVQGLVTPITDARISGNAWYMAADPNMFDTIEVTYLDGVETPVVETKDGWSIDGTEMKVRLDAGVNPLDYVGLYKNAGP